MFGVDFLAFGSLGLDEGFVEHALYLRRDGQSVDVQVVHNRHVEARGYGHFDAAPQIVEIHQQSVEHPVGDAVSLRNDTEQKVLGADVVVVEPYRFFATVVNDILDHRRKFIVHDFFSYAFFETKNSFSRGNINGFSDNAPKEKSHLDI